MQKTARALKQVINPAGYLAQVARGQEGEGTWPNETNMHAVALASEETEVFHELCEAIRETAQRLRPGESKLLDTELRLCTIAGTPEAACRRLSALSPPHLAIKVSLLICDGSEHSASTASSQRCTILLAKYPNVAIGGGPLATTYVELSANTALDKRPLSSKQVHETVQVLSTIAAMTADPHGEIVRDRGGGGDRAGGVRRGAWALTDARGLSLLSIGVRSADGALLPVLAKGAQLPAAAELLLTNSTPVHENGHLCMEIMLGSRPVASAARTLHCLLLPLECEQPGLAQVMLQVVSTAQALFVCARDVLSGRAVCYRADTNVDANGDTYHDTYRDTYRDTCRDTYRDTHRDESEQAISRRAAGMRGCEAVLPQPWRFETPYTHRPHSGFCCSGGRLVLLPADEGCGSSDGDDSDGSRESGGDGGAGGEGGGNSEGRGGSQGGGVGGCGSPNPDTTTTDTTTTDTATAATATATATVAAATPTLPATSGGDGSNVAHHERGDKTLHHSQISTESVSAPRQGGHVRGQGEDVPTQGVVVPLQGGGVPPKRGDVPPQCEELPSQCEDVPPRGGDVPPQGGDVAPEDTAKRVWPSAYLLCCYLQQQPKQPPQHEHRAANQHDDTHDDQRQHQHHVAQNQRDASAWRRGSAAVAPALLGCRVLELGAGCGLPGLVASVCGAAHVCLTDLRENTPRLRRARRANGARAHAHEHSHAHAHAHPHSQPHPQPQAHAHALAHAHPLPHPHPKAHTPAHSTPPPRKRPSAPSQPHSHSHTVSVRSMDWTAPVPASLLSEPWDVILAADCVFWPHLFRPLLATIEALCRVGWESNTHTTVLLAMTWRLRRGQAFVTVAEEMGWRMNPCVCERSLPYTAVYRLVPVAVPGAVC